MATKFQCDSKKPAIRALGEVAKKSAHVGITRRTDGRAWASVMSSDRAVLLEVQLADEYPQGAPGNGFVVTLGEIGDKPAVHSWPSPWGLGADMIASALYGGVADGSTTEVRIDEITRREMMRAASHAAKPDDGRLHLQGVWALESGGACAADGHRAVFPRHVYDGDADKATAWLPAALVHVLGRLVPSEVRVLMPSGRDGDNDRVWCAAEWDGGRAAFLADAHYLQDSPVFHTSAVSPDPHYRRAGLDANQGRAIISVRSTIEKSKDDHANLLVTEDGFLYLGLPKRDLFGLPSSAHHPDLVRVNPKYLADALRAVGQVREVAVNGKLDPIYIAGDDRAAVVMPMRV